MIEDAQYIACDNKNCINNRTGRCSLRTINLRSIKSTGSICPCSEMACLNFTPGVKREEAKQCSLAMAEPK